MMRPQGRTRGSRCRPKRNSLHRLSQCHCNARPVPNGPGGGGGGAKDRCGCVVEGKIVWGSKTRAPSQDR
eukprot:3861644-Rhodomonas_salina.3